MPLDLTKYESIYNDRKKNAILVASYLIKVMDERTCCDTCEVTVKEHYVSLPKPVIEQLCEIVEGIMYSSGFYLHTVIKSRKDIIQCDYRIMKMPEEDKKKLGLPPSMEENPTSPLTE